MGRQSGCLCCDAELLKERLDVESKLLVVLVDERPRCRPGGARWVPAPATSVPTTRSRSTNSAVMARMLEARVGSGVNDPTW
jgi:hypothetical protein